MRRRQLRRTKARCVGWARQLRMGLTAAALALAARASGTERAESPWRWEPPASARGVGWPAAANARELDGSRSVEINATELVLVPVDPGDQLRLSGGAAELGLASGTSEEYPDMVTWLPRRAPGVVRVPSWSSARFLALRAARAEHVRIERAARLDDGMREHRLDRAVYDWLSGDGAAPASALPDEQRGLAAIAALQKLLASALRGARGDDLSRGQAWLAGTWLERRLSRRRLSEPFFRLEPSELAGGQQVAEPGPAGSEAGAWRALAAGQRATLMPDDADVVSVALRARAQGQARVQVWSGDVLLHDVVWRIPRRAEEVSRWTPPRIVRVVPRGGHPLRVVALEGAVRVKAEARSARRGILESDSVRRRATISAEQRAGGEHAWLDELLEYHFHGGAAALRKLERRLSAPPGGAAHDARDHAAAALLAYEALPALVNEPGFKDHLARFWQATVLLPPAQRTALRIALLERVLETLVEPIAGMKSLPEQPGKSADHVLLAALLEAVAPPTDATRSAALAELERFAAGQGHDERLVDLAREAWSRAAPWTALAAPGSVERALQRRPFDANQPSGMCENQGARGLRWWIVPENPTPIEVLDLGGTHSAVRLSPVDPEALESGEVWIDDQPVPVQPALGEPSLIGVRPGVHHIRRRSGARVMARIPRLGTAPCDQLVEMERWSVLATEIVFQVPAGEVPTPASVIIEPSSLPAAGARVEVAAGGESVAGWVRSPASGDIELVVPAGVTELRVRSEVRLLVRARARLHPSAAPEWDPDRVARSSGFEGVFELPRLTAKLRATSDASERGALRQRRGALLHALGYAELAELDWSRAGRPELAERSRLPGALFLPERSEPVVRLGLAAQAPILPIRSPAVVQRALAHERFGHSARALDELMAAGAQEGDDAAALLAARLAMEAGAALPAAKIFERLGRATRSHALLGAAAESYDRVATMTRRLDDTERAFLLAKLAAQTDADAAGFLGRYGSAVEWNAPSLSALGVRTVTIDRPDADLDREPLPARVRRGLTLAPADARQFSREASFNVRRWRGARVSVESLCFDREGPLEGCLAEIELDGTPANCPPAPLQTELALPRRCVLDLTERASLLVVRMPAGSRRMGWARLDQLTASEAGTEAWTPVRWQQTYSLLSSDQPIRLELMGPNVLRVDARAMGGEGGELELLLRPLGNAAETADAAPPERAASLAFPPTSSVVLGTGATFSEPQLLEYVLDASGPHEVMLVAARGRLLVRPEIARVIAAPEPEPPMPAPPPPLAAPHDAVSPELPLAEVAERPFPLPFSLSAEASVRDRDLAESDADGRDRYAETALVLRRALWDESAWFEASALARFRGGAPSAGAELSGVSSPIGWAPGVFGSARVIVQPGLDAMGASATAGLRHRLPLGRAANLLPEVSATWRHITPQASIEPDADSDVYSLYALERPMSLDVRTTLIQRPFLDAFARHSMGVRLDLDPAQIDRIDVRSQFDLLAGGGHSPWIGLDLSASHRPSSWLRRHAFTRWQVAPRAMFWHWAGPGNRWRSEVGLSFFVDAPNPTGPGAGVFASLGLAYDFLLGDGLRDFRTSQRLFRARLEENGPSARPRAQSEDPAWREMESP